MATLNRKTKQTPSNLKQPNLPKKKLKRKKKFKPPPLPNGRPPAYTPETGKYICDEISKGRTMTSIVKEPGMPSLPTIYSWLNRLSTTFSEDFLKSYITAREIQAEVYADQTVDICDASEHDMVVVKKVDKKTGATVTDILPDIEHIQRSRLRVETRKWVAAHLLPRKFSDKMQLTGKDDTPLVPVSTKVIVNFTKVKPPEEE